jgi:N-acetylglucosaminyldiphosphoundecaprenol N-acetyl-beta-D-mannosaminyltransferase
MLNLCASSVAQGFTHFLFGGNEGVAESVSRTLQSRFPGIKIIGTFCPPFRPLNADELARLQKQVREAKPDFFWVGLSTPKQERFMSAHLDLLPEAKILVGVGAAFDLLTGRVRQAPRWVQRSGLEWFFRLTQEPGRLWKRYLVNNPLFIFRAAAQLLKLRKFPMAN